MRVAMLGLASWTLALGGIIALADAPETGGNARHRARSSQPASTTAPVVLRHTTFNIPFTVSPDGAPPVEIHLYLSTDRGTTWKLSDRAAPQTGHFPFRAASDGEYWFALKTIDKRDQLVPRDQKYDTGLRVLVDSTDPQLEFQAKIGAAGEIITSWQATDVTLIPASFKVEYQGDGGGPWRQVAVDRQETEIPGGGFSGQVTWWPETASRVLNIRAEVADQAMNKTVVNRRVVLPRIATKRSTQDPLQGSDVPPDPYVSVPESSSGGTPWLPDEELTPQARHGVAQPRDDSAFSNNWPEKHESVSQRNQQRRTTKRPAKQIAGQSKTKKKEQEVDNPYFSRGGDLANLGQFPPIESDVRPPVSGFLADDESDRGPESSPDPYGPQSANSDVRPPVGGFSASAGSDREPQSSSDPYGPQSALPQGEKPRMTNATQFQLEYDVESVGPTGIAEVQLWGTRDAGRTWTLWSTDDDKTNPLDVSVPAEGVFGFRVVVVGNNGLAGKKPIAGDLADLWIGVDTTRPTVRLTSAIYGEGRFAGQLDIRWGADDEWFSNRPITLQFSERAQGPWSTIASGIPNSGQYHWPVEPRIPQKIFLRIEAKDQAGNVGHHQLAQPVSTTGLIPQAHIRGFRPVANPADAASRWGFLK